MENYKGFSVGKLELIEIWSLVQLWENYQDFGNSMIENGKYWEKIGFSECLHNHNCIDLIAFCYLKIEKKPVNYQQIKCADEKCYHGNHGQLWWSCWNGNSNYNALLNHIILLVSLPQWWCDWYCHTKMQYIEGGREMHHIQTQIAEANGVSHKLTASTFGNHVDWLYYDALMKLACPNGKLNIKCLQLMAFWF